MKPAASSIQRTPKISSRRRALFPCNDNSGDKDLDSISPLNFDKDNECPLNKTIGDYDIIGVVENPYQNVDETPKALKINENQNTVIATPCSTILKCFPSECTPHDTSDNSKLPKLVRKNSMDLSLNNNNNMDSACSDDPTNSKNSKVRTALFPEMSFSPQSFYPKPSTENSPRRHFPPSRKIVLRKTFPKVRTLYFHHRRNRRKINSVSHSIKKPKKSKNLSKERVLEAAINIIEHSPLNKYLNESEMKKSSQIDDTDLDLPVENFEPETESESEAEPELEPEPNSTKKFFKSGRHKGIVTVNDRMKIEVKNGKFSLIENRCGLKRPKSQKHKNASTKRRKLDCDFDTERNDSLISDDIVTNIIDALEDKEIQPNKKPEVLMSPTSQMCTMTSGLAINSPKKTVNLRTVLENVDSDQGQKLFPVFYPGKVVYPDRKVVNHNTSSAKKIRQISKDQMLLDAGQKKFGATQCSECKFIYHQGDPGDEIMHLNYHNAGHIFRFSGWKNERVVLKEGSNEKVIHIVPGDPKIWWKKVNDVMDVINRDLGYYDIEFNTLGSQIFFYVKNKTIVGALVAEARTEGYRLLTTHEDQVDLCSENSSPIKCGVSRIWVSQAYRKKGIGTALMNCLKTNFIRGAILMNDDIALSSPTPMGKLFATSYFQSSNFLIYF